MKKSYSLADTTKEVLLQRMEDERVSPQIPLPFKRFDMGMPTLVKEDEGNAGFDLFARVAEGEVDCSPGDVVMVKLNMACSIPLGVVGFLFQRSSTYNKWGVKLTNSVGVIDTIFNGDGDEWGAQFKNETDEVITIKHGDKMCQAVFVLLAPVAPVEVPVLGNEDRGGFGTSFDNAIDKCK